MKWTRFCRPPARLTTLAAMLFLPLALPLSAQKKPPGTARPAQKKPPGTARPARRAGGRWAS